jgi:phosphoglycolate phosphatase-like HAD superfamily hydrolase
MMNRKGCIFFDLDGTLIDIRKRYHAAYVNACTAVSIVPKTQNEYWELKRQKISESKIVSLDSDLFQTYSNLRIQNLEDEQFLALDKPFVGVEELLEDLKQKGYSLFIATMRNHSERVKKQIQHLNLNQYFSEILATPALLNPAKEKAKLIQTKYSIYNVYEKNIMVGDTEADILCGTSLGFTTIAVESGIRTHNLLEGYHPNFLLNNVSNIISSDNEVIF